MGNGDRRYYPLATIWLKWSEQPEKLQVGVLSKLEEDIILGTDYEGFPSLLEKAGQEHVFKDWWKEAPSGVVIEDLKPMRANLSRRQKREQRHSYGQDNTSPEKPRNAGTVCTITGDF
ncbi:hypothetical protein NDU88_008290 [Pleurodeles waltl]|uniref:Uncharacterized protein n=1 Tax=Pleurodeles waltl TaxID=8319 RepID=A0AAV7VS40_PLEWA|nr:hypothetical protein NDU88_008290 [Pleurodeles waltl]